MQSEPDDQDENNEPISRDEAIKHLLTIEPFRSLHAARALLDDENQQAIDEIMINAAVKKFNEVNLKFVALGDALDLAGEKLELIDGELPFEDDAAIAERIMDSQSAQMKEIMTTMRALAKFIGGEDREEEDDE